ncbi:MAG1140 family protein [[Mycoplasma] collis]|uniref:MAG1140 family protein n=1 Tax=[Mycoplasma] collis TaxID=2127 RepID=UPI00051C6F06
MSKNYNFKILIFFIFLTTIVFILVLFFLYKLEHKKIVFVEIKINEKKELNFEINSEIYYKINRNTPIIIDKKFSKNNEDIFLKIREIKNIESDIFNVSLLKFKNLKIQPNTKITGGILIEKTSNIFEFIFK